MNINSDHPILGALFEKWRKEKDLNINTLAKEAHICTTTYGKIKRAGCEIKCLSVTILLLLHGFGG